MLESHDSSRVDIFGGLGLPNYWISFWPAVWEPKTLNPKPLTVGPKVYHPKLQVRAEPNSQKLKGCSQNSHVLGPDATSGCLGATFASIVWPPMYSPP